MVAVISLGGVFAYQGGSAQEAKEYGKGVLATIEGKNYLVAGSASSIEILEIIENDRITQVSEFGGSERVNDLFVTYEKDGVFLVVATGQYLVKYDINNPFFPSIVLRRDLYQYRKGHRAIGYARAMTGNDKYLFIAGSKGLRRFEKSNYFVDKTYNRDDCFGLAVKGDLLAAITSDKGVIYDIETGNVLGEYPLENFKGNRRNPGIDEKGNVYFLGDNNLTKVGTGFNIFDVYTNPAKEGTVHSNAVSTLANGDIFYVNGYGVTKMSNNFEKLGFYKTANGKKFGEGSWAKGVVAGEVTQGNRVFVLNKTSILEMDENLKFLQQYKYRPKYSAKAYGELRMDVSKTYTFSSGNDTVDVDFYGFWPNEQVEVSMAGRTYSIGADNIGQGGLEFFIPKVNPGTYVLKVMGVDSQLSYQVSFVIH